MNTYISLSLFVGVSSVLGFSLITGSESQNTTYSDDNGRELKTIDVFRQLLNQETIIRMNMAKDMLILKQSLLSTEGDISTLKQTTAELKKDLRQLERENERLGKENAECKETINIVRGNSDDMNKTIDKMRGELEVEQQKLSRSSSLEVLQMNISKNRFDKGLNVAFTAGIESRDDSWSGSTLVFPHVIYNERGGYNSNTGVFTALSAGTYVFYISVQSARQKYIYLDIMLNGSTKVRAMAYYDSGSTIGIHQTGTNLVVLPLQKADRVWVRRILGTGYWSDNGHITTFSGFGLF